MSPRRKFKNGGFCPELIEILFGFWQITRRLLVPLSHLQSECPHPKAWKISYHHQVTLLSQTQKEGLNIGNFQRSLMIRSPLFSDGFNDAGVSCFQTCRIFAHKEFHIFFSGEERNKDNSKEHMNKSVDEGKPAAFPSKKTRLLNHHTSTSYQVICSSNLIFQIHSR